MRILIACVMILVIARVALGQTTRPVRPSTQSVTTQPSLQQQIRDAEQAVKESEGDLAIARADAAAKLDRRDDYKALLALVSAKESQLTAARASGTPQQKVDAASAWNKARLAAEDLKTKSLASDPGVLAAAKVNSSATLKLADLRAKNDAEQRDRAAIAAAKRADEERAMADKAVPEVTTARLETMGESVANQRVKITNATFGSADNIWVDELPGVTLASNGLQSRVNVTEMNRWMGFSVYDAAGNHFGFCFASKDGFGERLVTLKKGQSLTLFGTVIKLRQPGRYGIMCDRLDIGPEPAAR